MELWIRSTAKTNLLKARFLTIMDGNEFYKKANWEYNGYTICNCNENGTYELLGTYKTKERALEVLDEIHQRLIYLETLEIAPDSYKILSKNTSNVYEMPLN